MSKGAHAAAVIFLHQTYNLELACMAP